MQHNVAWTIAGLDTSGGSGIAQDNKTFLTLNVHACTVLTAIVSQNNQNVIDVYYPPLETFIHQINSLNKKFIPSAIKIGLVSNKKMIGYLGDIIDEMQIPVIIDPVIKTSSGYDVFKRSKLKIYKKNLFKNNVILTPNLLESEYFLDSKINSLDKIEKAADEFLGMGLQQIIIKGGHFENESAHDYWTNGKDSCWLSFPKINKQIRGTGCIFSSALTACLAKGGNIIDAFITAKSYIQQGIENSANNFFSHQNFSFKLFPEFRTKKLISLPKRFLVIDEIGFYPIVDNLNLMQKLIDLGVRTIQLRIKEDFSDHVENVIKQACLIAKALQIQLFINDYWQLAIKYQAFGVHLGQDDLRMADLLAIENSGLRLGISVHNNWEFLLAKNLQPSYIAIGPVFKSSTKPNLHAIPLSQIKLWRSLTSIPLVGVGGIHLQHISSLIDIGMNGVAVISAIKNCNLIKQIPKWLNYFEKIK